MKKVQDSTERKFGDNCRVKLAVVPRKAPYLPTAKMRVVETAKMCNVGTAKNVFSLMSQNESGGNGRNVKGKKPQK